MKLEPRLVIITGISATGKSTLRNGLMEKIDNSFVLDKDLINQGILLVLPTKTVKLLDFKEYVARDNVFPNCARKIKTPFGTMIQVDPKNDFYWRHAKQQTYIVKAKLARENLEQGKVPIIDCFPIAYIINGQLKAFMQWQELGDFPKYLVHCTVSEEDCYQRHVQRAKQDENARIRDAKKITSRDAFHKFFTEEQPPVPAELANYKHLLVDTSKNSPHKCVNNAIKYIS